MLRNKQAYIGLAIAFSVAGYVIYATWDAARTQAAAERQGASSETGATAAPTSDDVTKDAAAKAAAK